VAPENLCCKLRSLVFLTLLVHGGTAVTILRTCTVLMLLGFAAPVALVWQALPAQAEEGGGEGEGESDGSSEVDDGEEPTEEEVRARQAAPAPATAPAPTEELRMERGVSRNIGVNISR
jgi:hypothetical protein